MRAWGPRRPVGAGGWYWRLVIGCACAALLLSSVSTAASQPAPPAPRQRAVDAGSLSPQLGRARPSSSQLGSALNKLVQARAVSAEELQRVSGMSGVDVAAGDVVL